MNNALHDTLSISKKLKGAGMNEPQAEAVTEAIHGSFKEATGNLATKEDLSALEARLVWRLFLLITGTAGLALAITRLFPT